MTEQLEKNMYLLDHSEKNILVHPRNPAPPPLEIKWWPPKAYLGDGDAAKDDKEENMMATRQALIVFAV